MPIKLHENLDPTEVTKRRMRAAEEGVTPPVVEPPSQKGFTKQWSQAEREMQQKALAKMLRERQ